MKNELDGVKTDFTFEEPWEPITDSSLLQQQLENELTPPHPLYGKVVRPLAKRADSDDILVETKDGYALVHLSWCRRRRPSPDFPHSLLLDNWDSFLQQVYEPDVAAWLEEKPEDEWDIMLRECGAPIPETDEATP